MLRLGRRVGELPKPLTVVLLTPRLESLHYAETGAGREQPPTKVDVPHDRLHPSASPPRNEFVVTGSDEPDSVSGDLDAEHRGTILLGRDLDVLEAPALP
jgi:hypothetical protein